MKQADGLRRIELPKPNTNREHVCYRNQLQPEYEFESEELKSVYQRHEAELLATAEQEAWDYLAGLRSVGLGAGGRFSMRGGNDGGMVCGAGRVKNPEESHLWLHLYALSGVLPAPDRPPSR